MNNIYLYLYKIYILIYIIILDERNTCWKKIQNIYKTNLMKLIAIAYLL